MIGKRKRVEHDWVLIDTQTLPSPIQQMRGGFEGWAFDLFKITMIQTFKCRVTKEVKIVRTVSGDRGTVKL